MKKTHVMIDIETLGTGFDSVVASIGAVQFNPDTGHVGNGRNWLVSVEDSARLGFKVDCETIDWWKRQPEAARKQLDGEQLVRSVTLELLDWLNKLCDKDDLIVWGNGPTFDLAILRNLFEQMDYDLPWHYWNERCVRTQVEVGRLLGIDPKKTLEFDGVQHVALDDAKHQARYVSVIWQQVSGLVVGSVEEVA